MVRADSAWVIASATIYGTPLRDSVKFILTNPYSAYVYVETYNNLAVIGGGALLGTTYIAPGGTITFLNYAYPQLGTLLDFVLDNPAAATATNPPSTVGGSTGNVMGLAGLQASSRVFATPGTYPYTATVNGSVAPFTGVVVKGKIAVQ